MAAILLFLITGCKEKVKESTTEIVPVDTPKVKENPINTLSCDDDSTVIYSLYLPEKTDKELPLVICFDPSGNALLPVALYKSIAEKLGVAIAGSMNSRNGQTVGQSVYFGKTIINDIIKKNRINKNKIFVAGFSGGARVATRLAEMNPNIKAVIGNSAGFEKTAGYYPSFGFIGIGGSSDMNMLELVNIHKYLNNSKTPHMLLMFDGIHQWAPPEVMKKAFIWMLCLSKDENAPALLSELETQVKTGADTLEKQQRYLEAAAEWETLLGCSNLTGKENALARENYERIKKLPAFSQEQKILSEIWAKETQEQNRLMAGLGKWKAKQWLNELDMLRNASQEKSQVGFMNRRLLSFLSLACLSSTNKGLATNDSLTSGYFSDLYTIVDPDNPESWYMRAVHLGRYQHHSSARNALAMAQAKGFKDQARINAQPELKQALISQ